MPVHQNLIYTTYSEALHATVGDIDLAHCHQCGFIFNARFDLSLMRYDKSYNNAQSFSATFHDYLEHLADDLVERYQLHNQHIIEIGCGDGLFISKLCHKGNNTGVGFDPAYQPNPSITYPPGLHFVEDYYSAAYEHITGDFYCSRHVIEHIPEIYQFVKLLANATQSVDEAGLFFETPNVLWILENVTFWDIFYEHCSLFSPGSIARAFAQHGFSITKIASHFGGQYMWVEGAVGGQETAVPNDIDSIEQSIQLVQHFLSQRERKIKNIRETLEAYSNKRIALWGAAAKGSTFLNLLNITIDTIPYAVDINPAKQGNYIAKTGQHIIAPDELKKFAPELIILTNPNYQTEVQMLVAQMNLNVDWLIL